MIVDGRRPLIVTDSTCQVWHWVKLTPDDVKLDQIYITDDPDDRPVGMVKVMKEE